MVRSGLIYRWLAVVAALCLALPVAARVARVHVEHLGVARGLMQSSVYAVAQGPQGYMWFGTQAGLQRYDGYRFVNYYHQPGQADSMAGDWVVAMAVGPDGSVWVSTNIGGLDWLKPGAPGFEHFAHRQGHAGGLVSQNIFDILPDDKGGVWLAGDKGLEYRARDGQFHFHAMAGRGSAPTGVALSLLRDRQGRLWVGTQAGLAYLDEDDTRLHAFQPGAGSPKAAAKALSGSVVTALMQDHAGRLWVGTQSGLFVLSGDGKIHAWLRHDRSRTASLASDRITAVVEDSNHAVWVAFGEHGLDRLDPLGSGWKIAHVRHDKARPDSVSSDRVQTLFRDATGLIWIGTYESGLDIYNPRSRAFGQLAPPRGKEAGLTGNIIWSILEDQHGDMWVGGQSALWRVDAQSGRVHHVELPGLGGDNGADVPVDTLYEDPRGALWVGTGAGLFRRDKPGQAFRRIDVGLPGGNRYQNWINLLLADRQGRLWVTTGWGLVQLDPVNGKVLQRFPPGSGDGALPDPFVVTICQTLDGSFWLGTSRGMRRFDGTHARYAKPHAVGAGKAELLAGSVFSCLADPDGSLWVGTGNGLLHYWPDSGKVDFVGPAQGLPGRAVFALLRDQHGDLWASTTHGLARIDQVSGKVFAYGSEDGVSNLEFAQLAAYVDAKGVLYFGGANGITTVYPDRLSSTDQPRARVAITGIALDGRQFDEAPASGALSLAYDQGTVTFNLAVFDYAALGDNGFRYRMEGVDSDWQTLLGRNSITYSNLVAGDYLLHVQGIDSSGRYSLNEATLAISVASPPWFRWWAWLAYVVVAVLLAVLGLRLFATAVRRRRDLASEKGRRRSAEGLNKLLQALSRLEDEREVAHEFMRRTPLIVAHQCAALFDVTGDTRTCLAARGFGAAGNQNLQAWLHGNQAWLDAVFEEGRPCRLDRAQPACPEGRESDEWMVLPMDNGSGKRYLLLAARAQEAFTEEELGQGWSVARQLSLVLDRAVLMRQLKVQASTDALTGINNRRAFLQQAEIEFARSQRQLHPLAMLLIDVDHFKQVNDSHGHAAGDVVLTGMVECCREQLRVTDTMGRYGGEEFVVCLPETSLPAALVLARRLREQVGESILDTPAGPIRVTISIGVAGIVPGAEDSLSALIVKADEALYEAKRKGRNRVQGHGMDEYVTPD